MKYKLIKSEKPKFKPFKIELEFETQTEVQALFALCNAGNAVAEFLQDPKWSIKGDENTLKGMLDEIYNLLDKD